MDAPETNKSKSNNNKNGFFVSSTILVLQAFTSTAVTYATCATLKMLHVDPCSLKLVTKPGCGNDAIALLVHRISNIRQRLTKAGH